MVAAAPGTTSPGICDSVSSQMVHNSVAIAVAAKDGTAQHSVASAVGAAGLRNRASATGNADGDAMAVAGGVLETSVSVQLDNILVSGADCMDGEKHGSNTHTLPVEDECV